MEPEEMKEPDHKNEKEPDPNAPFTQLPVLRGFTEIQPVWEIIKDKKAFICGGYVRYMASPHDNPVKAGDVDIYSEDDETFETLKKIFTEEHKLEVQHENHVSLTFKTPESGVLAHRPTIQLIKPINEGAIVACADMETILRNFDFTVVRIGLLSPITTLADPYFEKCETHKTLMLRNIHCPISSLLRCMKYARKGYFLRPIEALKLFNDWERRSDDYRIKINELFKTSQFGEMSQKEIDELESLLRID